MLTYVTWWVNKDTTTTIQKKNEMVFFVVETIKEIGWKNTKTHTMDD